MGVAAHAMVERSSLPAGARSAARRRTGGLALALFAAAAGLSLKTAWDLLLRAERFPGWFVPAFVAGQAVLIVFSGWSAAGIWMASREPERPVSARASLLVWPLLVLSFVCTSSVHQFHPFRPAPLATYMEASPVLRFNLALSALGLLATAAIALLDRAGRRSGALLGLALLGVLLLVPNDDCANPFNEWWLAALGASPLMFVPNLYAILFGTAALLGVRPRLHALALAAACAGVTLLGLGHMTRVIW